MAAKTALYTVEDVARWEEVSHKDIPFQTEALRDTTLTPNKRWQRFGFLAGAYETLTMVNIARAAWADALPLLRLHMEMRFHQYEVHETDGSAGNFQLVLLALITKDEATISRMVHFYRWEKGIPESVYLGRIIKSLALGDLETAKATLLQKRPRFERMFAAYPECLQAIVNKSEDEFRTALTAASKNWRRWASRSEKSLPDSVCFLQGVGLVRLAERVLGQPIIINDEHIPSESLR